MSWDKLQNKYGELYRPKLEHWQDSTRVVAFARFLEMHKDKGFQLRAEDGVPTLHFEPGLDPAEAGGQAAERWEAAEVAEHLFWQALPDIEELVRGGKLELREL